MNKYIDEFKAEAGKLLDNLQESLIQLEEDFSNMGLIDEIFRIIHTLKGTGGMFGFENISKLTHYMENIYDLAREGSYSLNTTTINLTLKITDRMMDIIRMGIQEMDESDNVIMENIRVLLENSKKETPVPNEIMSAKPPKGASTYYIKFHVDDHLLFRGVNLLRIFKELSGLGIYKIISTDFHLDKPGPDWGIYLVTEEGIDSIEDVFIFVFDNCQISKIADFNILDNDSVKEIFENTERKDKEKISKTILQKVEEINENRNGSSIQPKRPETIKKEKTSIHVDAEKLDQLMNLVSELITSSAILNQGSRDKNWESIQDMAEKIDNLGFRFRQIALDVRLIPIRELSVRFKRMVRDVSTELGKKIRFIIEGEETELDKNVINGLADPIMHILRNSIDHGIEHSEARKKAGKDETGTIRMAAYYSGTHVYINIHDDGAGIDPEKVKARAIEKNLINRDDELSERELYNLIMQPGFSTARELTLVSGRGVGLDVVQKKIEEMQGEIEINSEPGLGTSFILKLNQTISIVDTLLVKSGNTHFLIPLNEIEVCLQRNANELLANQNNRITNSDDLFPWINTRDLFHSNIEMPGIQNLIVVNKNKQKFAISADKIIGQHQAVLKPLGMLFSKQDFLTGASILGDGTLAFMLDLQKLKEIAIAKQNNLSGLQKTI